MQTWYLNQVAVFIAYVLLNKQTNPYWVSLLERNEEREEGMERGRERKEEKEGKEGIRIVHAVSVLYKT